MIKPLFLTLALGLLPCMGPGTARAENLAEVIMAPGLFAKGPEGVLLRYRHDRHLPALPEGQTLPGAGRDMSLPQPITLSELRLARQGQADATRLVMTEVADGKDRMHGEYPVGMANPVLLFFLENVIRNAAAQTGGSPYYFKNRVKEALLKTEVPPNGASTLEVQPFAGDANAARMGDFATLKLSLRLDPAAPGRLLELKADTAAGADGYSESLILQSEP